MTEEQIKEQVIIAKWETLHEAALHSLPVALEMLRLARNLPYPSPDEIASKAFNIAESFYEEEQSRRKKDS